MRKFLRATKELADSIYNAVVCKHYGVIIGNKTIINGRILIKGNKNAIKIGNNCTLNSDRYTVPLGYQSSINMWCFQNGKITIGNGCGLSNVTLCSAAEIFIGENVLIGGGTKIYDTDFHSLDFNKRMDLEHDDDRKSEPVFIMDGAFIGAGTTILKGVKIGEKSIIGAGAVVACDIPDRQIWGGNPAKFIREI